MGYSGFCSNHSESNGNNIIKNITIKVLKYLYLVLLLNKTKSVENWSLKAKSSEDKIYDDINFLVSGWKSIFFLLSFIVLDRQ